MSDDPAAVKAGHSSPRPGRNRSGHREDRRAMLVQAAMQAIRRHGPDVAMEDIATEAGISKPILYRHFQDKGDLYMAVSETATQRLRAALLSGLDTDSDPRELLRVMIQTYLTFIEDEPELYRFVVRRSFADRPVPQDPVTTNAELISATLATIFGDRLRSLGMDPGGAETWAHAGVGMVQAAGDWWLKRHTLSRDHSSRDQLSRDQLCDYLVMMAWGALDGILQAGGSPAWTRSSYGTTTGGQSPTEKPTRRLSAGPIST